MLCITFIKIVQSAYTVYSRNSPFKSRKSKTSNGGLGYKHWQVKYLFFFRVSSLLVQTFIKCEGKKR